MINKLFVVVVTFNSGHDWLNKCLGSIRCCTIPLKTVVIDNASADDSVAYIKANYPEVELFISTENLGFAKANNLGMKHALAAGAEHVFLLNHDAWFVEDCLEKLLNLQQSYPDFGILSPIHLNGTGELLDWNFTQYLSSCHDDGRKLYTQLLKREKLDSIYSVSFVNAAAWLISRACIEKVGLFDTALFVHYGEDSHFVQRAQYHQFKVGVAPECFISHDREKRSGKAVQTEFNQSADLLNFVLETSNILHEKPSVKAAYHLRHCLIQTFKALFKLDVNQFKKQLMLYRQMKKLLPVILQRREINKVPNQPLL
jgi:GT2 family glycosyltransferase